MSTDSTTAIEPPTPLGSRDNYYASTDNEYDPERSPGDPTECTDGAGDDLPTPSGVNRNRWIAHQILREADGTFLCPECWYEREGQAVLSDPEDYVAPAERTESGLNEYGEWEQYTVTLYGDHRRYRHCTECGVLGGGLLANRPMDEFLEIVDAVLGAVNAPASRLDELREAARQRKQRAMNDERNLELVLRDIRFGTDD